MLLLWASITQAVPPPTTIIRYIPADRSELHSTYYLELLRQALVASEDQFGPWQLRPVYAPAHQGRVLKLVARGNINVMWTMTSVEREAEARPIRIPLTAGLIGYRVLVVRHHQAPDFGGVTRLDQLARFRGVQGHDWPDLPILQANGLAVQAEGDLMAMYRFVHNGFCDYFARGVLEAWQEQAFHRRPSLVVEDKLLLAYPTAMYFFVGKNNDLLANRIEVGLRRLLADGRFDDLLFGFPPHRQALQQANISQRRALPLTNPLAPTTLPLSETALWFSTERYQRWLSRERSSHASN